MKEINHLWPGVIRILMDPWRVAMQVKEKYHYFRRGNEVCRYGIFGLSREYFISGQEYPVRADTVVNLNIPAPKIRVLQAVITAKCNLRCQYCSFYANAPANIGLRMEPEELKEICDFFNRIIGTEGLLFITGGEPEMYPPAVDYLLANISGRKIIFTNGTISSRARLEKYKREDTGILFSLDGDLQAQNIARRSKKGSFSSVARTLREANEIGLKFGISAVVGNHNIERLPELVEYIFQEFHPQSLGLNLPHKNQDGLWALIDEYTEAMIEVFQYAKREGLFIDQINRRLSPLIRREFRYRDCSAQGEKVVVFPGGRRTSCVNQGGLNGRKFDWSQRFPLLDQNCLKCYAIGICGGGCIFDGESGYGENRFDRRNCYFTRKMLETFIWDLRDEELKQKRQEKDLEKAYQGLLNYPDSLRFSVGHQSG